jgi:hypothetical protein
MRGRFALKKRLETYAGEVGRDLGLKVAVAGGRVASMEVGSD